MNTNKSSIKNRLKVETQPRIRQNNQFLLVVDERVATNVMEGKTSFGVVEGDDEFNSPEYRRNMNLHSLLGNNLGEIIKAPPDKDLSLAKKIHDEDWLMFYEFPYGFFLDPKDNNGLEKSQMSVKCIAMGKVGFITDDEFCYYPNLLDALKSDMGVIRKAVIQILQSPSNDGFAMVTHPGHHAGPNYLGGYCYINNVAIAAKSLIDCGKSCAIVDVDYHGGDGTYDCLGRLPGVDFVSIHAKHDYPEIEMYHNGREMPFGTTWAQYKKVLQNVVNAWTEKDVIIVSLGFDTMETDPLTHEKEEDGSHGGFELSQQDFFEMGKLFGKCENQILFIQEGGYDLQNVPQACVKLIQGFRNS